MKKEAKISVICHSIFALCFAAALAAASFYDLAISKALSDGNSFFGIFFSVAGEYPSYLVLPFCSAIIFANASDFADRRARLAVRGAGALLSYLGWFLFAYLGEKPAGAPPYLLGFALLAALFWGSLGLWLGSLVPKETMRRLFKFALFAVSVAAVALLLNQVLKVIWARMRYRDMLKEGNFDGFTPWYQPMAGRTGGNPDYDYTSFPSGHTSSAAHVFILCVLCDVLPSWKKRAWLKYALYAFCIIFTVTVGISRIVDNAHFFSDVLVGGTLTYLVFLAAKYIWFGKGKYVFKETDNEIKR